MGKRTDVDESPPPPMRDLYWSPDRREAFVHRVADLWVELQSHMTTARIAQAWPAGAVAEAVTVPIPADGLPDDELLDALTNIALRYSTYTAHPGFMGYISGAGTIPGSAVEMITGALNQNCGGFRLGPAATEIERDLMQWFAARFGLPADTCGGIVVPGGSLAILTCLGVARDRQAPWPIADIGLAGQPQLVVYASEEAHASVQRAAQVLGLGNRSLRRIPIDERGRMRVDALADAIDADRARGELPCAVVATAGTTATGAIDPLPQLARLCNDEDVWLHVDATYGGAVVLSRRFASLLAGIGDADSIAFDPHKWMGVPIGAGVALFRDTDDAYRTYHIDASYTVEDVDRSGATLDFGSHGLMWSRGFDALKIWVSLLAHGHATYGRRIEHDVALTRYLAERVEARPEFELMGEPALSICCFRFRPAADLDDIVLDRLNMNLMTELQLDGRAYCSNAIIGGRFALRTCIINFRTEAEDVDRLLDVAAEIGTRLFNASRAG